MIIEEMKNNYLYLKYVDKNEVIGFLEYRKSFEVLDITDVFVSEDYRNKKIASKLIDELIKREKDISRLMLEVNINNQHAIKLYEKFDFKTIHIRKNYYQNEDAYIMEKAV